MLKNVDIHDIISLDDPTDRTRPALAVRVPQPSTSTCEKINQQQQFLPRYQVNKSSGNDVMCAWGILLDDRNFYRFTGCDRGNICL